MSDDLDIPFDRVTYRDGQLLTALDLNDDHQSDARLRWLHNRYLHDTWGIVLGFVVKMSRDTTSLNVSPGYALDETGRELLLVQGVRVAVPKVKGRAQFVLTMSYQEKVEIQKQRDFAAVCLGSGLSPHYERPVFSWRLPEEARFGLELPLVCVVVESGQIRDEPDSRVRREARSLVRPHIGWGETESRDTGWRLWKSGEQVIGLEVKVDTSQAGFTKVPCYFALLREGRDGEGFIERPLGIFHYMDDAEQDSFIYRFISGEGGNTIPENWSLFWFGIEPPARCGPSSFELIPFFPLLAQWALLAAVGGVTNVTGGQG